MTKPPGPNAKGCIMMRSASIPLATTATPSMNSNIEWHRIVKHVGPKTQLDEKGIIKLPIIIAI